MKKKSTKVAKESEEKSRKTGVSHLEILKKKLRLHWKAAEKSKIILKENCFYEVIIQMMHFYKLNWQVEKLQKLPKISCNREKLYYDILSKTLHWWSHAKLAYECGTLAQN